MKRIWTVIILGCIAALVAAMVVQEKRHLRALQEFRQSVRSLTVQARARDSLTGKYLPCEVFSSNSGEDLERLSSPCSEQGVQITWITTQSKQIQVSSTGYSTQSFVIASVRTNVLAALDKLPEASGDVREDVRR